MRRADMLEHADRDDAVEAIGDAAVIHQLESDAVGKPGGGGPCARFGKLLGGQRHAE